MSVKQPEGNLKTELLPHQQRVVDKLKNQPGLVVAHGLGSGKTLTSIGAQEALGVPSTVVAPAALLGNYQKEQAKHLKKPASGTKLQSLQQAALSGKTAPNPMLIVDEAHRLRDTSTKAYQAVASNKADKRLLLTGSPFYNHPSDISPLINIAAGEQLLPSDRAAFEKRYITEKAVHPSLWGWAVRGETSGSTPTLNQTRAPELRKVFGKWVDHHPGSQENFPEVEHQKIPVPMTKEQLRTYDTVMGKAPPWVSAKVKSGLPPSKREASQLNSFLTGARQVANTTAPFQEEGGHSPKIQHAFGELQKALKANDRAKAVVYSNYLDAGINPYKQQLQNAQIPFGEFTGELSSAERNKLVGDYNANKLRVLLLSSAGGEGLDLKGTRLLQVLEPHWNSEKLKQVEGRGARYKSHEGLPTEEQKLLVQHYLATRPPSGILERLGVSNPGHSVDEYLDSMSQNKEGLIKQFRELLPKEKAAMIDKTAFFNELAKIGAITDEQAQTSLNRLDTLERSKPSLGQVGRYAGLGAITAPAMGMVGNAIRRKPLLDGVSFGDKARTALAGSVTGALGMGAMPLLRSHLDRRAEIGTLKTFMKQHELPPATPGPAGTEVSGKIAAAPSLTWQPSRNTA